MTPYAPQFGFLFEQDYSHFPGITGMIEVLSPGQELAKQREALGLTQQEVADRAKINIRQYQRLENGERSIYSSSFRIGLSVCHVLKIDPMFYCSIAFGGDEPNAEINEQIFEEHKDTSVHLKKYVLYNMDGDGKPVDVIAVEYGTSIDAAFKKISRAIRDDLMERKENKNCSINIFRREHTGKNRYTIDVAVIPAHAQSNIIVTYQIIEKIWTEPRF